MIVMNYLFFKNSTISPSVYHAFKPIWVKIRPKLTSLDHIDGGIIMAIPMDM